MIRPTEELNRDEFLDDINRKLAADSRRHNLTPDPQMGGLSPEQVARLIYLKWDADEFPMRMAEDLPLDLCERSRLFKNSRRLLIAIQAAGGIKMTSSGNLIRAFVAEMIDALDVNREVINWITKYKKAINEEDAWDLHLTRVICQSARLIRPYRGKFRVLKKAEKLLEEHHAGKLYRQLFTGLFTRFNLAYMDGRCPCHAIQQTLPYILYRLGKLSWDQWRTIEELPALILLPAVLAEVEYECSHSYSQTVSDIVAYRALRPLVELGLLEGQFTEAPHGFTVLKTVTRSSLFKEFLSFPGLP